MVESIDTITMRQYFRIVCSEPMDLTPLGRGTATQLQAAWQKIVERDAKESKSASHNRVTELLEDRSRYQQKMLRISSCLMVLSVKESESSVEILRSLGIEGETMEKLFYVANDRLNGWNQKLADVDRELGDRKRPTFADCMKELTIIKTYIPVSLDTTLAEYRAAQILVREMNSKNENNGKSDN